MKYLVTGGAGFIGSHLVEHLVAAGQAVVVLDDLSTGRVANLDHISRPFEFVQGSVLDPFACARAMRGVDYVLHEAALPSVPRSIEAPRATHDANATGTLTALLAARDAGVRRFVLAGSSSAYGNTTELPKREHMPSRPLSPYAASKLAAEDYCRAFSKTYGLSTVVLRYFNIFGPRQDPTSQYAAVVPRFIAAGLRNEAPTIFGDGEQTRDFTYVANVVRANVLACEAPDDITGETLNVACGKRVTVNDLWERIRSHTGATVAAAHQRDRVGDVRDSIACLENSKTRLGYEPVVHLDEGLHRTITALAAAAAT